MVRVGLELGLACLYTWRLLETADLFHFNVMVMVMVGVMVMVMVMVRFKVGVRVTGRVMIRVRVRDKDGFRVGVRVTYNNKGLARDMEDLCLILPPGLVR